MTTPTAPVDKARQPLMTRITRAMKEIDEALKCFGTDNEKAASVKEVKVLQAKVDAAERDPGPAATKTLAALCKTAEALPATIRQRTYDLFASRRRVELQGQVNGALAGALLDVGALSDPMLLRMMFAEQAKMKARMNKAEKVKNDLEAVDLMGDIDDEMPELQKRIKAAAMMASWLKVDYKAMLMQTAAAIKSVPQEKGRRALLAELDFVEAAKATALAKLDLKALQTAIVPGLRRINQLAARLVAEGSALEAEAGHKPQAAAAH